MPYYSIIVPVYNTEQYLKKCIESIISQYNSNWELILIDDGSLDNSGSICEEYARSDNRIKVFHKTNEGVSSARNFGINIAKGKWITFIDSDDYIEPNYLGMHLSETNSLIIGSWKFTKLDEKTEIITNGEYNGDEQVKLFIDKYLQYDIIRCPWGKFFQRDIINQYNLRYDKRFIIGEDTLFVMSYLLHCNNIIIDNSIIYRYYQPTSCKNKKKYQLSIDQSTLFLKEFLQLYKLLKTNNKPILHLLYHYYKGQTIDINTPEIKKKWQYNPTIVEMLWLTYYKGNPKQYVYYFKLLISSFIYKLIKS